MQAVKPDLVVASAPAGGDSANGASASRPQAPAAPDWLNVICDLHAEALALQQPETPAAAVRDWCQRAHDSLAVLPAAKPSAIAVWQDMLMPHFLKSEFLQQARRKPKGNCVDYLTVQMMHDACATSFDVFGKAVDAWAYDQPVPRAVRNRRLLVQDFLQDVCQQFPQQGISVVSLGCGPAAEMFELPFADNVKFLLLDIDPDALNHVQLKARLLDAADRVRAVRGNVIKMVLRDVGDLPGGQAAIYSLGLVDFFPDEFVVRLLDYVHSKLLPGGRILLGNFRPGHPNRDFFEHVLDWRLRLRSEADLLALVQRSRFAGSPLTVGAEPEGVQAFVACTK